MAKRPLLSKAELEVARVLWKLGSATVRQVYEAIPEARGLNFTTVQTYLRRLEEKAYVRVRLEGRTRVYSPRVKPAQVVRETVDDFLLRLFDGDAIPLFRHLVQERGVSEEEVQQLRRLLDQWESEQDDS